MKGRRKFRGKVRVMPVDPYKTKITRRDMAAAQHFTSGDVEEAVADMLADGLLEPGPKDSDGSPTYRLTEQGRWVRDQLVRHLLDKAS